MKYWPLRCALLLALCYPLRAADVESLHTFDFNFSLKPKWTLVLHTRARTFENLSAFNQFRVGPFLEWNAAPRLTALAGYYFIEQNTRMVHEFNEVHRAWAGGEYSLYDGNGWTVVERLLAERHIPNGREDYWRGRARTEVTRKTRIGEVYASGEALRAKGAFFGRYRAGMEWKLNKSVTLGAGYEFRDAASGTGSHVIATAVQWDVR